MLSQQTCCLANKELGIVVSKGVLYFRAADVTEGLCHKKSSDAIRAHVNSEYVKTWKELVEEPHDTSAGKGFGKGCSAGACKRAGKSPLYVSFEGVVELLDSIKSASSSSFKSWFFAELLPTLLQLYTFTEEEIHTLRYQHHQATRAIATACDGVRRSAATAQRHYGRV